MSSVHSPRRRTLSTLSICGSTINVTRCASSIRATVQRLQSPQYLLSVSKKKEEAKGQKIKKSKDEEWRDRKTKSGGFNGEVNCHRRNNNGRQNVEIATSASSSLVPSFTTKFALVSKATAIAKVFLRWFATAPHKPPHFERGCVVRFGLGLVLCAVNL